MPSFDLAFETGSQTVAHVGINMLSRLQPGLELLLLSLLSLVVTGSFSVMHKLVIGYLMPTLVLNWQHITFLTS